MSTRHNPQRLTGTTRHNRFPWSFNGIVRNLFPTSHIAVEERLSERLCSFFFAVILSLKSQRQVRIIFFIFLSSLEIVQQPHFHHPSLLIDTKASGLKVESVSTSLWTRHHFRPFCFGNPDTTTQGKQHQNDLKKHVSLTRSSSERGRVIVGGGPEIGNSEANE